MLHDNRPVSTTHSTPSPIMACTKTLFRPSVALYQGFANDPSGTSSRAFFWVFNSSLISLFALSYYTRSMSDVELSPVLVCLAPLFVVLAVLFFAVTVGITHGIALLLGGKGNYGKLAYVMAGYTVPLWLLTLVIGFIPYVSFVAEFLGLIHGLVLQTIAVKAVYGLNWERAIVPSIVYGLSSFLLILVVTVLVLSYLLTG